jgi:hypothetical protein
MSELLAEDVLRIYRLPSESGYPQIVPATREREWMEVATGGWANRCLPLRIANEAGWFILNDVDFEVEWDGDPGMKSLHFTFSREPTGMVPFNMVGYGILSWVPPYLFRTPAGINLLVRGPANMPKDGITALEGLVEADWLPYTFTINWKITRPGVKIRFVEGEPICFLVPHRRFDAERLEPVLQNISSDQELQLQYRTWHERRLRAKAISGEDGAHGSLAVSDQGQYIRGETIGGVRIAEHQTKLQVKPLREIEPPIATAHDEAIGTEQPEMHRRLKAFNGTVQITAQDVIITRRVGWWDRLFGRKASTLQIPLKKLKAVQVQDRPTLTQMAFIRFVIGDAPSELPYVTACRDPYTLLIDKPEITALQEFHTDLKKKLVRSAGLSVRA